MKIPLNQILEDEEVQRAICLIVQSELEEVNKSVTEKVDQLKVAEEENTFLKRKIAEVEREKVEKCEEIRGLRRELQNERARSERQRVSGSKVRRILEFKQGAIEDPESSSDHEENLVEDETKVTPKAHVQDNQKSGWVCSCGMNFSVKRNLLNHFRYFRAERKFVCSKCPVRFVAGTDMRKHLKMVHKILPGPSMRYGCRRCGNFFSEYTELLDHKRSIDCKGLSINLKAEKQKQVKLQKSSQLQNPSGQPHEFANIINDPEKSVKKQKQTDTKTGSCQSKKKSRPNFLCQCGHDFGAKTELQRHMHIVMAVKGVGGGGIPHKC